MAVKPVTNPNPPQPRTVNRGKQVSRKSDVARSTNEAKTALPGASYEQDFEVTLKDLDTTIMNHIKNIMALKAGIVTIMEATAKAKGPAAQASASSASA